MAFKLNIHYLTHEELSYELNIRGLDVGTVDEMRKSLRAAVRLETESTLLMKRPEYPYAFTVDLDTCTLNINEIKKLLGDLTVDTYKKKKTKIESKLYHTISRIRNSVPIEDSDRKQKSFLLTQALGLSDELVIIVERILAAKSKESLTPAELTILESSIQAIVSEDDEAVAAEPHSSSLVSEYGGGKPIPVAKWDLKFDGSNMSVGAFLERVDDLCCAWFVSKSEVFRSAYDLFAGQALVWYRAVRPELFCWRDLEKSLRAEFQPFNFNERLMKEILQRTQGSTESIGIYVAIMTNLFNRLTCPISEQAKLKILLGNIKPFYQTQLSLIEVDSIAHLKELCRRLEETRESVTSFKPPTHDQAMTLEHDLAYVDSSPASVSELSVAGGPRCFNCSRVGHIVANCRLPRKRKCYTCGLLNYTRLTCPKCSENGHRQS